MNESEQSLVILGRQPALGIAELESLFGSAAVALVGSQAASVTIQASNVNFARLGGAVKLCEVITVLDKARWGDVERYLVKAASQLVADYPEGKIQVGLSAYDFNESPARILATGLSLKKAIKKAGRSVRLTPNQEPALSSAQVLHNHLTGTTGLEIVVAKSEESVVIARTINVQDIDGYTLRDRGRPKRDSRVGMLPPKLAQTIVNIAVGTTEPSRETIVLDPFCGTGVILQEAILMGYGAYGTDLENRMIDYSQQNLDWLPTKFELSEASFKLEQGDATDHHWQPAPAFIACETYLGKPFTSTPDTVTLSQTVTDCNLIIKKFLRNIANQTTPGARFCVAIPAWQIKPHQFRFLPLVDSLAVLGYNRMSFEHVSNDQLLYYREDQIVARQLIVLTRI